MDGWRLWFWGIVGLWLLFHTASDYIGVLFIWGSISGYMLFKAGESIGAKRSGGKHE